MPSQSKDFLLRELDLMILEQLIIKFSFEGKPMMTKEIIKGTGYAKKNVIARLKTLEKRKLVVRKKIGRTVMIEPTDTGAVAYSLLTSFDDNSKIKVIKKKNSLHHIVVDMPRWWTPGLMGKFAVGLMEGYERSKQKSKKK